VIDDFAAIEVKAKARNGDAKRCSGNSLKDLRLDCKLRRRSDLRCFAESLLAAVS